MERFLLLSFLVLVLGLYSGCSNDGTNSTPGGAGQAGGAPEGSTAANPSEGFYVKVSNPPVSNPDGSSWENAFGDLQAAIEAAYTHTTKKKVYVAVGTYKPTSWPNKKESTDEREKHFTLRNGVYVIGGYPGLKDNEPNIIEPTKTILSGDLDDDDTDSLQTKYDNAYHVFYHPDSTNLDATAKLSNVTITKGNANRSDKDYPNGGGMYNRRSSPTLKHVTFISNRASYGGGMYNQSSSPILTDCTFTNNEASRGAGIDIESIGYPKLTRVLFKNNRATGQAFGAGGGMRVAQGGMPTLTDCTFTGNTATKIGGGISNREVNPILNNVTFTNNWAPSGGGIFNDASNPDLNNNCTFTNNTASISGGAMYSDTDSNPKNISPLKEATGSSEEQKKEASKDNRYYKQPPAPPAP